MNSGLAKFPELQKIMDRIIKDYGVFIDIYDGWIPLVLKLNEDLAKIDPTYQIAQVKTKFAGLRFYYFTSPELPKDKCHEFEQLVENAEQESKKICEFCGKSPAKVYGKTWIYSLCENCAKEKNLPLTPTSDPD